MLFPLVLLRLHWKSIRQPAYRKRIGERLGFVRLKRNDDQPVIWLHAVSVGETQAARPLIEALIQRYPGYRVLVTSTTPTGSDTVLRLFSDRVEHVYFPYDFPPIIHRFLKRIKPRLLIIMETEIWPNLYAACATAGIPVMLANARLSQSSTKAYRRLSGLVSETLQCVSHLAVRDAQDAENFRQLGAPQERVTISGNIKFDLQLDKALVTQGLARKAAWGQQRPVLLAASTHEGEEKCLVTLFSRLRFRFPHLLLVLVPRHPERFDTVFQQIQADKRWRSVRHSTAPDYATKAPDIILGDTMGEMQAWIAGSSVVFVGGSLVRTGGHNPLDAVALGVPVVTGPHVFNFEDIYPLLLNAGVCRMGKNSDEVAELIEVFLRNGVDQAFRLSASRLMKQYQGVTGRLMKTVELLLQKS